MSTHRALPYGSKLAGAAALMFLAGTGAWAQSSDPQGGAAQTTEQQAVAPVDPVITDVRRRLAEAARGNVDRNDRAALAAYYTATSGQPLWVTAGGYTARGKHALAEIGRAEDWGLSLAEFELPRLSDGEAAPAALADAEIKLGLAVLEYARHARGGRIDPGALSVNFDMKPALRDPKVVLEAVAATDAPGAYLVGLHPKHDQFEKLRQALLAVRGGIKKPEPVVELQVRLPDKGPVLKPGMSHPDVALLRQRLKAPGVAGRESFYDPVLQEAVAAFQRENKMTPDGVIGARSRSVLNGGSEPAKPVLSGSETQRLIANMERWRWLPEDLGTFHVWDNVPEFAARVVKANQVLHTAKIVVGKVENQTPIFSASMRYVVFHPEWGVPDGIKLKELAPSLQSSGGGLFGLFQDTSVLQRHNLRVSLNGKAVDPNSVNWSQVDIRRFSFIQPAGATNVLGLVKFRFPNKHDVYMHDTSQRDLFKHSVRAFSHGCMRVENPGRLAELLLEEDKGWSAAQVQKLMAPGGYNNEVELTKQIPVHITYFTALAQDDGTVKYFGDLYGHDKRVTAALDGKPMAQEVAGGETPGKEVRKSKANKQTSNDFFGLFGN